MMDGGGLVISYRVLVDCSHGNGSCHHHDGMAGLQKVVFHPLSGAQTVLVVCGRFLLVSSGTYHHADVVMKITNLMVRVRKKLSNKYCRERGEGGKRDY
jgi:hypothetical protein